MKKIKNKILMKLLKRTFLVRLQCCLWISLTVFASIGCSAKQNLFSAFDFEVEKPLSVSKTLLNSGSLNCSMLTSLEQSEQSVLVKNIFFKNATSFATSLNVKPFFDKKNISEDYILQLAGTDPPLYLIFQKIKLALL